LHADVQSFAGKTMPLLRRLAVLSFCFAILSGIGCSTVASTLGFAPPVHKLIPPAEEMRMAAVNPAAGPKELDKASLPAYVVEPGDTLAIEPVDLDSPIRLPGNQPVLPDGTIDLGKYGRPVVAWKTVPQIEVEVRKLIDAQSKEKAGNTVFVRLIGRESKVFYVLGEANAPRSYPLAGRETVLDGILAAGGLTRQADLKRIILSRPTSPDGCRIVLPVCYNQIVQLGDVSTNYQLQPGDRIFVPSKPLFDRDNLPCNKKNTCGPCQGPQVPCATAGCAVGAPTALVPVAPQ
jgi:protein involved in polysaccharide export with SLBB domain